MSNLINGDYPLGKRRMRKAPSHPLEVFTNAKHAVDRLIDIFEANTAFLRSHFNDLLEGENIQEHIRAYYPQVRVVTDSHVRLDSRLSYGFVSGP
ncbi:MAG: AMP nucleosidase, partial [Pseudomonadota bacterium]